MTNLRKFRPGLWLTELVLNEFDVRGAVIVGEQRVLVWDTLSHPRDMAPVAELAGGKPIYVVYSHADWDHCWGTAEFKAEVIIGHGECAARFASGEVARYLAQKQAAEPGQWGEVQLIAPTVIVNEATIDLGGVQVTLHSLAGHTLDCMVALIPAWGILLAGDTVETPLPVVEEAGAVFDNWIDRLSFWAANEQVQTVIPSHGEIGDRSLIERNLRYLRDLRSGKRPDVPAQMDAFYTETHAGNLKIMEIAP
jgi:glyoxylase-like metal-dependent hydrolase (beta-lactamase superfamily II)